MTTLLSMRAVGKVFRAGIRGCSAEVTALRSIDLEVVPGDVAVIVGAPAAGKSTLVMCAAGLLRHDRGTIAWFGRPLPRGSEVRPHGIAFASERPFHYGFLSVREALEYRALMRDLPVRDTAARVSSALAASGLAVHADRRVDALDAVGRARLSLSAALLGDPSLLCVDYTLTPGDTAANAGVVGAVRWAVREVCGRGGGAVVAGDALVADALVRTPSLRTRQFVLEAGRLHPVPNPSCLDGNAGRHLQAGHPTPAHVTSLGVARVAELLPGQLQE